VTDAEKVDLKEKRTERRRALTHSHTHMQPMSRLSHRLPPSAVICLPIINPYFPAPKSVVRNWRKVLRHTLNIGPCSVYPMDIFPLVLWPSARGVVPERDTAFNRGREQCCQG
jgi:hypothetical protein